MPHRKDRAAEPPPAGAAAAWCGSRTRPQLGIARRAAYETMLMPMMKALATTTNTTRIGMPFL